MPFRWNDWNLDHVTQHGVSIAEAEEVIRASKPPYPEARGDDKWRVVGRGSGGRFIQVIYLVDDDGRGIDEDKDDHEQAKLKD